MEVRLVIVAPPKSRKAYTVRLPLVVGRGDEAKFRIPQDSVSRRHCEFACGPGGVTVTDLGSTNGTVVGGKRLEPHAAAVIPSGAEVRIGGVVLRVEYVAEAVAAAAAARDDDDTVPLSAAAAPAELAEPPELEPLPESPSELELVTESLPELEPIADAAPAPATAGPAPEAPPAFPAGDTAPGELAFPAAPPAADATDFATLATAEPAQSPVEGSFDFLGADPAPPAADDNLEDFFKSLS